MHTVPVEWLDAALWLAGLGQLVLVAGSVAIPVCLQWKESLASLPLLMRQIFLTYAGYMLGMHLFFGVLSTFGTSLLIDGSPQAAILSGLIALWWFVRLLLQFFCFDRKGIPQTRFNRLAEALLVVLFFYLAIVYAMAWHFN